MKKKIMFIFTVFILFCSFIFPSCGPSNSLLGESLQERLDYIYNESIEVIYFNIIDKYEKKLDAEEEREYNLGLRYSRAIYIYNFKAEIEFIQDTKYVPIPIFGNQDFGYIDGINKMETKGTKCIIEGYLTVFEDPTSKSGWNINPHNSKIVKLLSE